MKFLVTGGAGFIGSHVSHALVSRGHDVIIFDDFSSGRHSFVPRGAAVIQGSLLDVDLVDSALASAGIDAVIHIAGYKHAGESVIHPLHTYEQNVTGMMNLLEGMRSHGVTRIIFSSSSAVYGDVDVEVISEDHPTSPKSPYGESKLIGEWLLRNVGVAYGMEHTSLRYFNVVGSSHPGIFDVSPYSLFSLVFQALSAGTTPKIFGNDYNTADGTCVRDYIPVGALADAHVVAAERMVAGKPMETAYNLGTGTGHSVAQVMAVMSEVTGFDFQPDVVPRRAGDPATVVASGELATRDLGWSAAPDLHTMIEQAWTGFSSAQE